MCPVYVREFGWVVTLHHIMVLDLNTTTPHLRLVILHHSPSHKTMGEMSMSNTDSSISTLHIDAVTFTDLWWKVLYNTLNHTLIIHITQWERVKHQLVIINCFCLDHKSKSSQSDMLIHRYASMKHIFYTQQHFTTLVSYNRGWYSLKHEIP